LNTSSDPRESLGSGGTLPEDCLDDLSVASIL